MILGAGINPFRLSPVEIACGVVFGGGPAEPARSETRHPLAAIERAVLPALRRPPCLISFSGGLDSSAVLAVAAAVARREGLPAPIPATNRFPNAPGSDETYWQELVIRHVGVEEWVRLEHDDELDALGPVATAALERHGLLWPFNTHFQAPILAAAAGGSLLTGIGGDEALGRSHRRAALSWPSSMSATPRHLRRLAAELAPRPVRKQVIARRMRFEPLWLRPAALAHARRDLAADASREPMRQRRRLSAWGALRYVRTGIASLDCLATDRDVAVIHPLAEPQVLAALSSQRRLGTVSRGDTARDLFGALLPPELYGRTSKAHFDEAFFGPFSRAFTSDALAEVDDDIVDPDVLSQIWAAPNPDTHTLTLLQAAWLSRKSRERA